MKESVKNFCRLNGLNQRSANLVDMLYNAYIGSEANDNSRNKNQSDNAGGEEQAAISESTKGAV
nr:MAG TPA: hypothetical protein [Caudoviricetes sp.]